jgi:ribosome biogenesis protein ENP2
LLGAGSSEGLLRLYDLRFSEAVFSKQHPYMLGINSIEFNRTTGKILSSDAKSLRIYDKNSGELFTSVEPGYAINKIVPFKDTGLIFMPCEHKRIGAHFIPSLGPAPKFCSFLDNLTEEMEETNTSSVYDEYKFLTMEELEKLNGKHLIGGYILKSRMYDKVKFSSKINLKKSKS